MENVKLINMFRSMYIPVTKTGDHPNMADIAALVTMAKSYGFIFSKKTLEKLTNMNKIELSKIYFAAHDLFEEVSGRAFAEHRCFYPSFPEVPDLETQAIDAVVHYFTVALKDFGFDIDVYLPEGNADITYDEYARDFRIVNILTDIDELNSVYSKYLDEVFASKALTEREDNIRLVYNELIANAEYTPKAIKFKELFKVYFNIAGLEACVNYAKTINDVMRIMECNAKTKLARSMRKLILNKLNSIVAAGDKKHILDDMNPNRESWLRIFEVLHPGDYAKTYPKIFDVVNNLRNGIYETTMGRVNDLLATKDINNILEAAKLLYRKPGVFLRNFDRLLRSSCDICLKGCDTIVILKNLLDMLSNAISKASIPVAVSLYNYYSTRNTNDNKRVFIIKGDGEDKVHVEDKDTRSPYADCIIDDVQKAIMKGISMKFAGIQDKPIEVNKIYIDESMKKYSVPETDRNASDSLTRLPFGSVMEFNCNDHDIIRFFTHWKNSPNSRVDIDLSCHTFDDDLNYGREYSWRSRYGTTDIVFSGDITDAPKGAFEYMDVSLNKFNYRYVLMVNSIFCGPAFKDIPECFSGVMIRDPKGIQFNDSSVKYKFDLNQEVKATNVAVLCDLKDHKLYYIDSALTGVAVAGNIYDALGGIVRKVLANRLSQYEFFTNALKAAGYELVEDVKDAEFIISDDEKADLHPWDQSTISSKFLSL